MKSLISSKDFKLEAFAAYAKHASVKDIESYVRNDKDLLVIAAKLGKVTDAKLLMNAYSALIHEHDQVIYIEQLAFLKHDAAYKLCNDFILKLKFTASSTSTAFLIQQSQTKDFAHAALVRMKEVGWNAEFNKRAIQIVRSRYVAD